jgi:hypothetical protein
MDIRIFTDEDFRENYLRSITKEKFDNLNKQEEKNGKNR